MLSYCWGHLYRAATHIIYIYIYICHWALNVVAVSPVPLRYYSRCTLSSASRLVLSAAPPRAKGSLDDAAPEALTNLRASSLLII